MKPSKKDTLSVWEAQINNAINDLHERLTKLEDPVPHKKGISLNEHKTDWLLKRVETLEEENKNLKRAVKTLYGLTKMLGLRHSKIFAAKLEKDWIWLSQFLTQDNE